ncbi:MAG: MATE family efflux transporter [Gammaproteobacteria bacterium]
MLLSGFYRAILVASGKSYVMNLVDFVSDVLRGVAIGMGAAVYRSLGITMALIAVAFAVRWFLMGGAAKRLLDHGGIIYKGRMRMRSLRLSARIGVPFALSALLTVVFGALDKAVIARMKSLSDLAVYSLSYDVTTKGWMLVWAVNSALLPALMRMGHAGEGSKIARIFVYTWISVVAIAVMVYLPLNLFEPQLVGWWVGKQMASDTRPYIALFSLASLFYFAVCVFYNFFQAAGQVMMIAKAYFIGLLFYLAVVALGALQEKVLIIASAHLVLWITVSSVLAYFFIVERQRQGLAAKAPAEPDTRRFL